MKHSKPLRPARPPSGILRAYTLAATLSIVAISCGLYALHDAGVIGRGALLIAASVTIPLATYFIMALEWHDQGAGRRRAPPASDSIDIVKLFQEDLNRIIIPKAPGRRPDDRNED